MKEGKAIPYQPDTVSVVSTKDLLERPTSFLVYPDDAGFAEGHFFVDDGSSVLSPENHALWKFRHADKTITFELEQGNVDYEG